MTIKELHYNFLVATSKVGGNDTRSFSQSEVDIFLNKAQRIIMNQNIGIFELDSNKTHEFSNLHIKYPLQPTVTAISHPNIVNQNGSIYFYEVNTGSLLFPYYSFTRISATQIKNNCSYNSKAKYLDADDINEAFNSSFDLDESTIAVNMGRSTTDSNSSIYIYSKSPLVGPSISIEYIKEPRDMNYGGYIGLNGVLTVETQCELSKRLQDKLVDLAVAIAYGAIGDNTYQLKKDQLMTLS